MQPGIRWIYAAWLHACLSLSVEIVADRTGTILLDDLDDDGAVRLLGFLDDLMLGSVLYKLFLVMFHFLFNLLYGPIMCDIFFQHEMKSLTDTGCFYSLHNTEIGRAHV